jgi:hypothetical protein
MKIIKKIINDKNKIIIYKKKNKILVDKIFQKKNLLFYKNEILGINYFKKNKYFEIPKVYSYRLKNNLGKITLEYIDGKKTSVCNINKIFKSDIRVNKKVNLNEYLNNITKDYKIKKKSCLNNFNIFKKKISVSMTHGDLVNYNCLEKNKKFYIFDFEKFRERIAVFDYFNWVLHPLTFKISKYFILNNRNILIKIFNNFILMFMNIFIKSLLKRIFFKLKINFKEFDLYYFLFLYEKIFIIENDLYYVKNKKVKSNTRKHIFFLKFMCHNLLRVINKNYDKNLF